MRIGQDLLNVPMGDMIRQMALAIAEAQFELDKTSIMVAEMMGGQRLLRDDEGNLIDYDDQPLQPRIDENGQPMRDNEGNLVYQKGRGPRVIDSRVYFGYTYVPERDDKGEIVNVTRKNEAGETVQVPRMIRRPNMVSMMELGFAPNFYQFVDTIIEVKIAIKMTRTTDYTKKRSRSDTSETKRDVTRKIQRSWSFWGIKRTKTALKKVGTHDRTIVQNVDATYSSKYSYSAEGSSLLRTKLVPIPPPSILEERIREVMALEREYIEQASTGIIGDVEND